jgi:putative inorganic carbon (HCO3(-)) transporter
MNLDNLILLGILMTLFFMPLHEKLKAAGFWLTLAFWLTKLYKERKDIKIWIPPLGWALLLFVGVAFLSAVFSDYHNRATRGALDALRNTLVFLIIINTIDSYDKIKYLLYALMGGIVIGDVVALHQYFTSTNPWPSIEMLSLGEKNSTAQVLSMFLAMTLGLLFTLRKEYLFRMGLLTMIALTGFVLTLTYARGIWVAVLAMLVVFGLIRLDWKVPVILAILFGSVLLGMSYSNRFADMVVTLENPLAQQSMRERFDIWNESLRIVKDKPLLGIGLKTYGLHQVAEKYHLTSASHAHNMFLNVATELGLVGLTTVVLGLVFYLKALLKMYPHVKSDLAQGLWFGGVGCFIILLVGGIMHPMLGSESSLTLMTILGLGFSGFRVENSYFLY